MPDTARLPRSRDSDDSTVRGWEARLRLAFACRENRTVLTRREHSGPLVVQKPLYPEGDAVCQCIVVHPPGGIAGGDRLALDVEIGARARVQLTTPGAAKWYRSNGADATQSLRRAHRSRRRARVAPAGKHRVRRRARPMHHAHRARRRRRVHRLGNVLSRPHGRERAIFQRRVAAMLRNRARRCTDLERARGIRRGFGDCRRRSWACVARRSLAHSWRWDRTSIPMCLRAAARFRRGGDGALTQLPGVLVARYRGAALEAAHDYFRALWAIVRPALIGRAACIPRIWST